MHDAPGASRADKAMASANADAEAGAAGVVQKMNTQSRGPIAVRGWCVGGAWVVLLAFKSDLAQPQPPPSPLQVFMDVWPQASSVGFSFFVTLALFPGTPARHTPSAAVTACALTCVLPMLCQASRAR